MITLCLAKNPLTLVFWMGIAINVCKIIGTSSPFLLQNRLIFKRNFGFWKLVDFIASCFTTAATHATSQIGQHTQTIGPASEVFHPQGCFDFAQYAASSRYSGYLKEFSSINFHLQSSA
jgi:hypothetical protein